MTKFYVLRYREMTYWNDASPKEYKYTELGCTEDRSFLDELVRKYHLHIADNDAYFDDGYEIIEKSTEVDIDYDYIVKHSDRHHIEL